MNIFVKDTMVFSSKGRAITPHSMNALAEWRDAINNVALYILPHVIYKFKLLSKSVGKQKCLICHVFLFCSSFHNTKIK